PNRQLHAADDLGHLTSPRGLWAGSASASSVALMGCALSLDAELREAPRDDIEAHADLTLFLHVGDLCLRALFQVSNLCEPHPPDAFIEARSIGKLEQASAGHVQSLLEALLPRGNQGVVALLQLLL